MSTIHNAPEIIMSQLAKQLPQIIPMIEDLAHQHPPSDFREAEKWMRTKIDAIETMEEFSPNYIKVQLFIMAGLVQKAIITGQRGLSDTITFHGSID